MILNAEPTRFGFVDEAKRLAEAIAYNEVSYSSLVTARLGSLGRIADDVTALLAEVERLRDELLTRDMIWLPAKDAEIEWLTKEVNYLQECINKSHA